MGHVSYEYQVLEESFDHAYAIMMHSQTQLAKQKNEPTKQKSM